MAITTIITTSGSQQIPILMYHSISDETSSAFRSFAVAPRRFAEQMAYLHAQGYTPLTVSQLIALRADGREALPPRPVLLTFDDGFADFATSALPILQEYRFTATLYVTTAYISGTSAWLRREGEAQRPLLTWKQLRKVAECGIECGSHTHTHPQLDMVPLSRARQEIQYSKEILEQHLGLAIHTFAYPYGYYTPQVRTAVAQAGYSSACAVKFSMSTFDTDTLALARLKVSATTEISEFAALLEGHSSSPLSQLYTRLRTPAWRMVRRYSSYFSA